MPSVSPSAGRFVRRRRANVQGGRHHSHRVLVTPEEEAVLVQLAEASRISVPRLLIEAAMSGGHETSTERREGMATLFSVRRLLAATSNNLNQLARHANAGGGFPAEAAMTLVAIKRLVRRIDAAINGLAQP